MQPSMHPVRLALLIGNSSVRHAIVVGGEIAETERLRWEDLAAGGFRPLAATLARTAPCEVVVGSVRDDRLAALLRSLGPFLPPVAVAGRDFSVPVENRYREPSRAGLDRLLNVLAAGKRWPGRWTAVLDFGTALSVSVAAPDGAFAGGLIGIGPGAAAAALHRQTPRLPEVTVAPASGFLQRDTEDGIRAGIFWQLAGGVERIIEGLRGELGAPVVAVATGGGAPLFAHAVRGIDETDPDLTMKGLVLAAGERR